MVLVIYIFLLKHHDHIRENYLQNFLQQKLRSDKYGAGRVASIRSLAPISLVKSGLHFAPSYDPTFHFS